MSTLNRWLLLVCVAVVISSALVSLPVLAAVPGLGDNLNALGKSSGYDTQLATQENPLAMVVSQALLALFGVLGMIFLVIVVYAGFRWMTAGGNSEQITEAQELIKNAAIGLAIVILSYTITYFIGSVLNTSVSN